MSPAYEDVVAENEWLKEQLQIIRTGPTTDPLRARFELSPTEARFLCLMRERGEVTRDAIYAALFQRLDGDGPGIKIIDVFACKVRKKLAAKGAPGSIRNIWGQGYRLDLELRAWLAAEEEAMVTPTAVWAHAFVDANPTSLRAALSVLAGLIPEPDTFRNIAERQEALGIAA